MQEFLEMTIEDCGKEQKLSSSQAKVVEGHPWPRSPFLTNMPDQRELSSPSMVIGEQHEIRLSEEEAYDLAAHLKQRLQDGTPLDADPDSIAKMVAGLGDPGVFYAFVLQTALEMLEALPYQHFAKRCVAAIRSPFDGQPRRL